MSDKDPFTARVRSRRSRRVTREALRDPPRVVAQSELRRDCKPRPCCVYLLVHDHEPRFKIGLSVSPLTRLTSLPEARSIDKKESLMLELPSQRSAYAMLTNSDFKRFPTATAIHIDQSNFFLQDNDPDFWGSAQRALTQQYAQRIQPELASRGGAAHLTIAGFAPIPMLMKLGALIGDKTPASVMDLPGEQWLWDTRDDCPEPRYTFAVPASLPRELSIVVSISGRAQHPIGRDVVEFQAVAPDRGIIRKEAHVQHFRTQFNTFLQQLFAAGARVLHVHPATPLSASIEIGRTLLPKAFDEVHVWEWQAPEWKLAVRLK